MIAIRVILESIIRIRRAKSCTSIGCWDQERVPGGGSPVGQGFWWPPVGSSLQRDLTRRAPAEGLWGYQLAGDLCRFRVPGIHLRMTRAGISGGVWWRSVPGDPKCR